MVSVQPQQSQLRDAAGRAQPVRTSRVRLAGCMGNATKASAEGLDALETFVAPAVLEATRVVCLAPPRQAPLVTDLAIALNGQDYTLNHLEFAYYTQPTSLTHLTPIRAGPTAGGSSVTVHGTGLAAFAGWGAPPAAARCRWDGTQVTIPTALTAGYVVRATAP